MTAYFNNFQVFLANPQTIPTNNKIKLNKKTTRGKKTKIRARISIDSYYI